MIEDIEIYKLFAVYFIGFVLWSISIILACKYRNVIFAISGCLCGLFLYDLDIYLSFIMIAIGIIVFFTLCLKANN